MSAIEQLIDHCHEQYPHLESARGQADILAATAEFEELVQALKNLNNLTNDPAFKRAATRAGYMAQFSTAKWAADVILRKVEK